VNSGPLDGLTTEEAKARIVEIIEAKGFGKRALQHKLRDWLFSRQRYWGEPFPIVYEEGDAHHERPIALPERFLPVTLPEIDEYKPVAGDDPTAPPRPPLGRAKEWVNVELDLGDGPKRYLRELNTMPQWAGSCWYYLRYLDPENAGAFVSPEVERYWMLSEKGRSDEATEAHRGKATFDRARHHSGGVDLYVGGAEHAVLHLLYARFWHKVLFDLAHISTPEPFMKLVNQGTILGEAEYHVFENGEGVPVSTTELRDMIEHTTQNHGIEIVAFHRESGERCVGRRIPEDEIERRGNECVLKKNSKIRIDARSFKMSKSRGNVVGPDEIVGDYGADAFRLYEMYMGPLEAQKPWSTRDIVGMARFLNSVWRNLAGDEESKKVVTIDPVPIPDALDRQMHRAIRKVGDDIGNLRFNTAIAELIKLNNEMGRLEVMPRELAETFVLLLAPFAPHIAEEIWAHLGHTKSLARRPWPIFDEHKLVEDTMELPVQVNGKLRDRITVAFDADEATVLAAAERAAKAIPWIEGKDIRKRVYVPKKLVNFVVG
jgi:leucyl-tRNA synthetase